jgi:hypothetical protein
MNEWEEEGKMNPVAREFYVIIERDAARDAFLTLFVGDGVAGER